MKNPYKRYQTGLVLADVFPTIDGVCACGCGVKLTGSKKKWASKSCNDKAYILFSIIKGNTSIIRNEVFLRDKGFCHSCGVYDDTWQADHIIEVREGGGYSQLSNFQTLCTTCHKEKTYMVGQRTAMSEQETLMSSNLRAFAFEPLINASAKTSKEKQALY